MRYSIFICFIVSSHCLSAQSNFNFSDSTFQAGQSTILDVRYEFSKSTVDSTSYLYLDSLVSLLIEFPRITIEVSVHEDSRGGNYHSRCLSCIRAKAVFEYLIEKKLNPKRITSIGRGYGVPLISDEEIDLLKTQELKELAHQKNRRTEIKITSVNSPQYFTVDSKQHFLGDIYEIEVNMLTQRVSSDLEQRNQMIQTLISLGSAQIQIEIHTDIRGNYAANLTLSKRVSDNLKSFIEKEDYLAFSKISQSKYFGESRPIYPSLFIHKLTAREAQERLHAANRRAQFKIIKL